MKISNKPIDNNFFAVNFLENLKINTIAHIFKFLS